MVANYFFTFLLYLFSFSSQSTTINNCISVHISIFSWKKVSRLYLQRQTWPDIRGIPNNIFFFQPLGILLHNFSGAVVVSRTLHPAVWDTHISSSQFAQSVDCLSVQAYSCGEGLLGNLFGVRPIPTRYSLYALHPLLPGLEPRARTMETKWATLLC